MTRRQSVLSMGWVLALAFCAALLGVVLNLVFERGVGALSGFGYTLLAALVISILLLVRSGIRYARNDS